MIEPVFFPGTRYRMPFDLLKLILPDRPLPTRILRGPFRDAVIVANRRDSLRKIFGLYEQELNAGSIAGHSDFGCRGE